MAAGVTSKRTGWRAPQHRLALAALTVGVVVAHLWVTHEVSSRMQELAPPELKIKRMEATYVTQVSLSAPPVAAAALPPPAQTAPAAPVPIKKRKPKPVKAASAPEEPDSVTEKEGTGALAQAPAASEPAKQPDQEEASPEDTAQPPAYAQELPSTPAGPTFVWPKATKVSYKLEGYFRGPFYGTASVEWVRQDNRYQVRLDANVPLLGSMSMISEGLISREGLAPERYESVNKVALRAPKVNVVSFEDSEVVLGTGERVPRAPNMQDPVSLLIHLAYQFITRPQLLKPGNTIELPLAYGKKAETLAFDVMEEDVQHTDIGDIPALRVKPRRTNQEKGDLVGETWFAPTLQYLPIRILTKAGEVTLDMKMEGSPQQTPGDEPGKP
ncbi:hypothetical protein JY96_02545 [Aquabacterium sp. NJ1]|uniref:DUF3108 domain-containing protein n=1 Tax=Aquabacterium sp. NJ1 TaxID=1538295 RepID=UPI00052C08C7|nr:DUF3108 domain-containing protein [Aquabacterium sp. NJ1]KGM39280.1 hypothetical protein JY96_02545 [Aquabacterium sp. NJ1]